MTVFNTLQRWLNRPGQTRWPHLSPHPSMDEEEIMIAELYRLGLHHLSRTRRVPVPNLTPQSLLVGLSRSSEPRVRAAITLLLLMRPDYAEHLEAASTALGPGRYAKDTFDAAPEWGAAFAWPSGGISSMG